MQYPRSLLGEIIWKRAVSDHMAENPESKEALAERLAILQEAKKPGSTQTAFAIWIGLDVKRWNNFLAGKPLSKDAAMTIVRKCPGITYEWLWHGKLDAVPMSLQAELEAAGKRITSAAKERSRAG